MTFDPDPQIGWRAVEAMGAAARRIAPSDPQAVHNHLRRLHWLLCEESGGQCWRAPEAMAEIVRQTPDVSADYLPIVLFLIDGMAAEDLVRFYAGLLWAIGRLAPLAGDYRQAILPWLAQALDHSQSQVRGMAVWSLAQFGETSLLSTRRDLLTDDAPVDLYEATRLIRHSVGGLLRRAIGGQDGQPAGGTPDAASSI